MIEWSIFYRILEIPEDIVEPTYYDLLGLRPEACNGEIVDRMLDNQKSRLRQNIPGPQFIPLVLTFEQKKLERAASVLRDPKTRRAYDKHLRRKALQADHQIQQEKARQALLRRVRDVIVSHLNPDKTLDSANRPVVSAALRRLHIKQSVVDSLLARIPEPASQVAKFADEAMDYFITAVDLAISGNVLTPDAEMKLMELARKLGMEDKRAAETIDRQLGARHAQRGERDVSLLRREFENRLLAMFPGGTITADQYELLVALARADNLPEAVAREVLRDRVIVRPNTVPEAELYEAASEELQDEPADDAVLVGSAPTAEKSEPVLPRRSSHRLLWSIVVPIAAVGLLGMFAATMELSRRDRHVQPAPRGVPLGQQGRPAFGPGPRAGGRSQGQQPQTTRPDDSARSGGFVPGDSGRLAPPGGSARGGYRPFSGPGGFTPRNLGRSPRPSGSGTPPPAIQREVTAAEVRDAFSTGNGENELLADFALVMLACYVRATHLTYGSADYDELRRYTVNRDQWVANMASITVMSPSAASSRPQNTAADSNLPPATMKAASLQELGQLDTPQAAEELLGRLGRSDSDPTKEARILRVLCTMTVQDIPKGLIEELAHTGTSRQAFQIARTLAREAGIRLSPGDAAEALLPFSNNASQRKACARWWQDNCPVWGQPLPPAPRSRPNTPRVRGTTRRLQSQRPVAPPFPGTGRITSSAIPNPPTAPPAWEPDPNCIRPIAIAATYAQRIRDVLKDCSWDGQTGTPILGPGTSLLPSSCSPTVGADLLEATAGVFSELSRLAMTHPRHQASDSAAVERIELCERKPRMAACETTLQKCVVNLDASFDLLRILVERSNATGDLTQVLAGIEEDRAKTLSGTSTVMEELRESSRYNLILWDMLVERNARPVPSGAATSYSGRTRR